MPAVRCASRARLLAATKLKPGGVINPFCDPAIATSTPQASIANGTQPSDATVSTMNRASCRAALMALPIVAMSLHTLELVGAYPDRAAQRRADPPRDASGSP